MPVCVLLALQRSGTGALGSLLDQHPDVAYFGEVFHNDSIRHPPNFFWHLRQRAENEGFEVALPGDSAGKLRRYFDYLDEYSDARWKIIDVKYDSVHHLNGYWIGINARPTLFHHLHTMGTPIIHLMRRNLLRMIVSGTLADANKVWHTQDAGKLERRSVPLDMGRLLFRLDGMTAERTRMEEFLRWMKPVTTLEYSEMLDSEGHLSPATHDELRELLQVDGLSALSPVWAKQTGTDLEQVVENFADVSATLRGTAYEWMLDSD